MSLYAIENRESFAFSAENPTGTRNGGTRGGDCEKLNPCVGIKPGETRTLVDTDGPGMITHIWFTGYVGHSFILRIYWDGADFPSVEAPISAFFGSAYDENFETTEGHYSILNSALILVAPGRGLNSYFEMPFHSHCRITLENRGGREETLFYMISGWRGEIPENAGYFHAVYRQEHPVARGRSYVVLDGVEGRGTFVGMTLAAGMNGNNTCWVEGEAKMYLDGERYPSLNYTGTEDYFCGSYAFGNDILLNRYEPFSGLYAGMYVIYGNDRAAQYNGQQRFLLYRWHVKDPVYFAKSFRMVIDNLGWTGPRYDDYTTVAYWYLDRPACLPFALPEDREMVMK
ncbi:MAG: DUF2961 domain-containing protein [Clostridia bacterium]|nr:DUF2961 domain-containing protein [Clostridia bacterium]